MGMITELERTNGKVSAQLELETSIHSDERAFTTLWRDWELLAARAGTTICSSPEWTTAWWKHFGREPQRSLCLITIRRGGELVALAPMYYGHSTTAGRIVERRLQLLGSGGSRSEQYGYLEDYGISDFLDILVLPEEREAVASHLIALFDSDRLEADRITFHQARDDSFIMTHLYPGLADSGTDYTVDHTDTCPYIDLNGSPNLEAFIGTTKSNARRRFRQTLRAEREDEVFRIRSVRRPDELDEAIDRTIRLHQDRWNELGFPGVFHDDRFEQFFRELVHLAARKEWLWFRVAEDESGIVASRMLLNYQGRYYDYISGFDDSGASAKYRPGIALLLKATEDAIMTGLDRIELLRGEEGYKYDFTNKRFRNWRLSLQPEQKVRRTYPLLAGLVRIIAQVRSAAGREIRLLRVQRRKAGPAGMIQGYLAFRWKSVQLKLQQNQSPE